MIRLLSILSLLFLPGVVLGKTFECSEATAAALSIFSDEQAPILVVATIKADGKTGTIEVADRKFEAEYQIEGLDRAWRFITDERQEYGYLFLIQPDGTAAYYDLETSKGEPTYPDQNYFCGDKELATEIVTPKQATDSEALGDYIAQIRQKIVRNWSVPASADGDLNCTAQIRQVRGGEIVGVTILQCNGNEAVRRSIEAAIYRSSPLPEPSDPSLFDTNIEMDFGLLR